MSDRTEENEMEQCMHDNGSVFDTIFSYHQPMYASDQSDCFKIPRDIQAVNFAKEI